MASSDLMESLMALCEEKHIDQFYLIDSLETAIAEAYAKQLKLDWGARVTIDRTAGKFYLYKLEPIDDSMDLEGSDDPEAEDYNPNYGRYTEYEEIDITPDDEDMSRTAAQKAKETINNIIRHAAREEIYEEFKDRIGDIITGTVLQATPEFTIIKIREGVEAELPHFDLRRYQKKDKDGNLILDKDGKPIYTERNERPARERYQHNQRIKAVIIDVLNPNNNENPKQAERSRPSIVVSRTHPDFLRRLFEQEVPEIYDGLVEIKSVARDAGDRSKVAVASLDSRLDPVGACVGPKGSRVRTVVTELRGERVDVVLWSDDIAQRVANALSPAKVTRVIVDEENHRATAIVPDDQLSLAIGSEGQNVRLAARLTGMKLDIKNESLAAEVLAKMPSVFDEPESLIDDDEPHRCEYVGANGLQCRNMAAAGSKYCELHSKLANASDVEVSDDPDSLI